MVPEYHKERNNVDFKNMESGPFLLGLLSAFENKYQAKADSFFKDITWKQFFAIICIQMCKENPTINELSDIMGSSHQNVKQILNKLEKKGFVQLLLDEKDKRKQRITLTLKCQQFCKDHEIESLHALQQLFQGITEEEFSITIQTIMKMERNLQKL